MKNKIKIKNILLVIVPIICFGFLVGFPFLAHGAIIKSLGQTARVTVNCSDSNSNLANCSVTSPCSKSCSVSGASGSCFCDYTCVAVGTYESNGTATDTGGLTGNNSGPSIICNTPPTADAGPNKIVWEGVNYYPDAGQPVILDGSGSDPDGGPITYQWSCTGGTLSSPNIAQPTYTAPAVNNDRNYTCTLTVTDNMSASASDSTVVTVKNTELFVSLATNPDCTVLQSCRAPVRGVSLTATVLLPQSTAIGSTVTYTFWCDCNNGGTNPGAVKNICRNQAGQHNWDLQVTVNGPDPNIYAAQNLCNYITPAGGTYTPKVIAEKGLAAANEKRVANFTIQPNTPPQAINLRMVPSSCTKDCGPCRYPLTPVLYWDFADEPGDYQTAFEIHLADNQNFNNYTNLTGVKKPGDSQSYTVSSGNLEFGEINYWWRVRVWDSTNPETPSNWAVYGPYETPLHAYPEFPLAPNPAFAWSPTKPNLGKEVQFTDQTKCYNAAGNVVACGFWSWAFQDAYEPGQQEVSQNPLILTQQNPVAIFSVKPGEKSVTLKVTDNDGFYCDITQKVITNIALPRWREIIPW